jgi:hypothetical protein
MKILMAAILLLMGLNTATAGPDSDLLQKAGLLGAWAADCSKPPSQSNPYQIYAPSTTGYPKRILSMASSIDGTSEIRNVRLLGNNKISMRFKASKNFDDRDIIAVVVGNRHRSLEAADVKGKKYVTDGKYTTTPGETPWFQKCGG